MTDPSPPPGYSPLTRALHWASAVLVIAAFALGLQLEDWPRGPQRDDAMMVHYSLGTVVLALALVRVLRRILLPRFEPPRAGTPFARFAASAMHWVLYGMMIVLPVTGVLDRWARGRRLAVFGDFEVPPPFPIPGDRLWRELHEWLGYVLAALVLGHFAAALWHHVVLKDSTLRRMLRGERRRSSP